MPHHLSFSVLPFSQFTIINRMPQEQPAYVPSQFYTTKYTLLLFIVFHLISGLVYAFLAINFLSQPELSRVSFSSLGSITN